MLPKWPVLSICSEYFSEATPCRKQSITTIPFYKLIHACLRSYWRCSTTQLTYRRPGNIFASASRHDSVIAHKVSCALLCICTVTYPWYAHRNYANHLTWRTISTTKSLIVYWRNFVYHSERCVLVLAPRSFILFSYISKIRSRVLLSRQLAHSAVFDA